MPHQIQKVLSKIMTEVVKKELGINSSDIKVNHVYLPCKENIDIIIKSPKVIMKKNHHINIPEDGMSIPLLFWIPKSHKNPYKSRFIAGASSCTTKQLSVEVALCLKEIKQSFSEIL